EIAPGADLERDILALMDFTPLMPEPPRPMDDRIFREAPMGLRDVLLSQPLAQRLSLDERDDIFFINFENLRISTREDVEAIEHEVETRLAPLGRRVYAIVNYDHCRIDEAVLEAYTEMVRRLEERFYSRVTRYTTSSFMRRKLGHALEARAVPPHIYEDAEEARAHLKE
ncbi:hypothetical protein, partial [Halomonas sp.]|uniref:hypothetical protein n=1 Tax=Halomonas sp. TaxID=1486246 RepID=UPI00356AF78D